MRMGVECPCQPICNDIVTPHHLFPFLSQILSLFLDLLCAVIFNAFSLPLSCLSFGVNSISYHLFLSSHLIDHSHQSHLEEIITGFIKKQT